MISSSQLQDDWTLRLYENLKKMDGVDVEYTAQHRSLHVQNSWMERLPVSMRGRSNFLLFHGSPDLIVKLKESEGMLHSTGDEENNEPEPSIASEDNKDEEDDTNSQVSGRFQMGHQMTSGPYKSGSCLPEKVGGLMAALHTSLVCRALRKYSQGKAFSWLIATGLFVHKAEVVVYVKFTLSEDTTTNILAKILCDGFT